MYFIAERKELSILYDTCNIIKATEDGRLGDITSALARR